MIAAATLAAAVAQVPWVQLKAFIKERGKGRIPRKELFACSTKPALVALAEKYGVSLEAILYMSPVSRCVHNGATAGARGPLGGQVLVGAV